MSNIHPKALHDGQVNLSRGFTSAVFHATLMFCKQPITPPPPGALRGAGSMARIDIEYLTATVCPITMTTTEKGTTKVYTDYTTSTVVITSCPGGSCGGEVTVPGPTAYTTTTDVE